mmetsp:Transcript_95899/g.273420  ORF Transcript_95899/g.273420 Transcript_95899/m.273420 type:complete len:224 (-) Transcript_95899:661-1332(-)
MGLLSIDVRGGLEHARRCMAYKQHQTAVRVFISRAAGKWGRGPRRATPPVAVARTSLPNRDHRLLDVPPHIQAGAPPRPANRLRHGPQPGVPVNQLPHLSDGHVCKSTEEVADVVLVATAADTAASSAGALAGGSLPLTLMPRHASPPTSSPPSFLPLCSSRSPPPWPRRGRRDKALTQRDHHVPHGMGDAVEFLVYSPVVYHGGLAIEIERKGDGEADGRPP